MKHSIVLFKSDSNNCYLYSYKKNQLLLIHPLLYHIISLYINDNNIEELVNNTNKGVTIENIGYVSRKEILFQFQKFNFYKENGYFDKLIVNRYHYTGDDIDFFASNTRNLTFEVTEKCNLSCTYCIYGKYYNNNKIGSKKDLDFSVAKNIIDYFICNWTSNKNSSHKKGITIGFYGGEALLNFDLISQIVSYVKSTEIFKENHIGFTMTTNGVLLGKHISFLVENNFDLLISLDGGTEHNNSYRTFHNNKSAFDIIYNNIIASYIFYKVG